MNKTNIIIEIGYNHLGSPYLLDNLINVIINNGFDLTFQIRPAEHPSCSLLYLELDFILDRLGEIRSKAKENIKVGFAIDSLDHIDKIYETADFIKLLGFFPAKDKFLSSTNYTKPIYVSLAMDSIDKVKKISAAAKANSKQFNALYTSYDNTGMDISIKEISLIDSFSDSISFGYHQNNISKLAILASNFPLKNIFVYINPGFMDSNTTILPDASHSLKIEDILRLNDALVFKDKIINNPIRKNFKNFLNE